MRTFNGDFAGTIFQHFPHVEIGLQRSNFAVKIGQNERKIKRVDTKMDTGFRECP